MTHGKGQEITAVDRLLDRLPELPGSVLTFDALHTNHRTMETVVIDKGADYLMQVKANASVLCASLEHAFIKYRDQITVAETVELGHGRIDRRRLEVVPISPIDTNWPHTYLGCRVTRERQLLRREEVVSCSNEQSIYVASFPITARSPDQILDLIRGHWSIENCLHHRKDRSMDEDRNRASAKGIGRVMCCIRSLVALVAGRSKEPFSVIQRRFSAKTYFPLRLLFARSLAEWEQDNAPYKLA